MTADMAQMRGVGQASIQYAFNYKRYYPFRSSLNQGDSNFGNQPVTLTFWRGADRFDDTVQLEGYIPMGTNSPLNCPFTEAIDIEGSDDDTWIMSPYALYFGWALTQPGGSAPSGGIKKLGNSMRFDDDRYKVLVADDDLFTTDNGFATHPDKVGVLSQLHTQDEGGPGAGSSLKTTISRWQGPSKRGTLDNNFCYDDASAERINDIVYNESRLPDDGPQPKRVGPIPYTWKTPDNVTFFRQIPKAN